MKGAFLAFLCACMLVTCTVCTAKKELKLEVGKTYIKTYHFKMGGELVDTLTIIKIENDVIWYKYAEHNNQDTSFLLHSTFLASTIEEYR